MAGYAFPAGFPVGNGDYPLPRLVITEQPQQRFRFRYESELGGTHGQLVGRSGPERRSFPTVKLEGWKGEAIIRCELYTTGAEASADGAADGFMQPPIVPHVHTLQGRSCTDGVAEITVDEHHGYTASFQGLGIIHTAKKKMIACITRRMLNEVRLEQQRHGILWTPTQAENDKFKEQATRESQYINMNRVCLRFQAVARNPDTSLLEDICLPVFSDAIYNGKSAETGELRIVQLSQPSSPCTGNEEIWLLVERVRKNDIRVRLFEEDELQQETWSAYGVLLKCHHQYAIIFQTPAYKKRDLIDVARVFIQLERPSDGCVSKPHAFQYTAVEQPMAKRFYSGMAAVPSGLGRVNAMSSTLTAPVIETASTAVAAATRLKHVPGKPASKPGLVTTGFAIQHQNGYQNMIHEAQVPSQYHSSSTQQLNFGQYPVLHAHSSSSSCNTHQQHPTDVGDQRRFVAIGQQSSASRSHFLNTSSAINHQSILQQFQQALPLQQPYMLTPAASSAQGQLQQFAAPQQPNQALFQQQPRQQQIECKQFTPLTMNNMTSHTNALVSGQYSPDSTVTSSPQGQVFQAAASGGSQTTVGGSKMSGYSGGNFVSPTSAHAAASSEDVGARIQTARDQNFSASPWHFGLVTSSADPFSNVEPVHLTESDVQSTGSWVPSTEAELSPSFLPSSVDNSFSTIYNGGQRTSRGVAVRGIRVNSSALDHPIYGGSPASEQNSVEKSDKENTTAEKKTSECVKPSTDTSSDSSAVHSQAMHESVPVLDWAVTVHLACLHGNSRTLASVIGQLSSETSLSATHHEDRTTILNMYNQCNQVPLHVAVSGDHVDCVALLMNAGVQSHLVNSEGNTVLHIAAEARAHQTLDLLLKYPSVLKLRRQTNRKGYNAIHCAVLAGDWSLVTILTSHGVNINCVDDSTGQSSLHLAVRLGNYDLVVKLLSMRSLDVTCESFDGTTALQLAAQMARWSIVSLLKAHIQQHCGEPPLCESLTADKTDRAQSMNNIGAHSDHNTEVGHQPCRLNILVVPHGEKLKTSEDVGAKTAHLMNQLSLVNK